MGNKVIAGNYSPYICLLGQLLKKGGAKTSERQLLELFQTIEKHCDWFPPLETLDVRIWETVGRELRVLHDEGVPIPVSNWSTWSLSKSVLEPTQTTEDLETKEEGEFTPLLRNLNMQSLNKIIIKNIWLLSLRLQILMLVFLHCLLVGVR